MNCFGQVKQDDKREIQINYNDLLELKTDIDVFQFGWLPTEYMKVPCFRDYRNENTERHLYSTKNDEEIKLDKEPRRTSINAIPNKISINTADSTFTIQGYITKAWKGVTPDEFEIYIGHRKDTISNITLSPNLHGEVYYNGKKVTETIVINKIPAFYLKDFKKFKCTRGVESLIGYQNDQMIFDINSKIDENSILIFALSTHYAEIFEIGKIFNLISLKGNKK